MGLVTKRLPRIAVPVCWHAGFACQLGIKFLKCSSNLLWGVKQGFTCIQDHVGNRTRLIWVAARHLIQSVTWSCFLWLLLKSSWSWIWIWATKKPPGFSLAFGERSVTAVQSVVWLSGWFQFPDFNWCGFVHLFAEWTSTGWNSFSEFDLPPVGAPRAA